jgi:hypothetical protein
MSHFTVAVSEDTFRKLFAKLRDQAHYSTSGSTSGRTFRLSYSAGFRLQGGTVDLQAGNSIAIHELDIVYDPLSLNFQIDIPEICIGGWCLLMLFGHCIIRAPRICIFSANPDISIPLNIGGILTSEISGAFRLKTRYYTSPARAAGMRYLTAEDNHVPNKWQFLLEPIWLDIDPIDVADTVGNLLNVLISNAINGLLGWLPGWARSALSWLLGGIADFIRLLLDIPDDIDEWLSNLLGTSIGLLDWVLTKIAAFFADMFPIFQIEDPLPVLPYDYTAVPPTIPVKIPLLNMAALVNDTEMILTADVGATL